MESVGLTLMYHEQQLIVQLYKLKHFYFLSFVYFTSSITT
jgi:hypothetical protein